MGCFTHTGYAVLFQRGCLFASSSSSSCIKRYGVCVDMNRYGVYIDKEMSTLTEKHSSCRQRHAGIHNTSGAKRNTFHSFSITITVCRVSCLVARCTPLEWVQQTQLLFFIKRFTSSCSLLFHVHPCFHRPLFCSYEVTISISIRVSTSRPTKACFRLHFFTCTKI